MFKKLAKSILMVMLLVCSFTFVACGDKNNNDNASNNGGLAGKAIEKIELMTELDNSFFVGDSLDLTEAKIKVTYENKTTEEIVITSEMIAGFDTSTAGEKTLTVTYEGKTINVPYSVAAVVATSIAIKSNFKTAYYVGDPLDISGGKVTITYNNSTSNDVDVTAEHISNFSTAEPGNKTLKITVEGKELEIPYTVTAVVLQSISIKTPFKTTYFVGDTLDVANSKLTLTYNNGKTEDIDIEDEMISGFDSSAAATINLTLTHSGKTISNISCQIKSVELVEVSLKAPFADTEYFVGEAISLTGNKLVLSYNNGKSTEIDILNEMISNFDSTSAGNKQFVITYSGHIIPVDYTVTAIVATTIELVPEFTKITYFVGDNISINGEQIKVTYNNGNEETLPVKIDMISDFSTSVAGEFEFKIEYKSISLSVTYTVSNVEIVSMTLSKPFNKTTYYSGQSIDVSGAEITIVYNNGKEEILPVTLDMVKANTGVEGENKKMSIKYNGSIIYAYYTVIDRQISPTPESVAYSVNDEYTTGDIKLQVIYNFGASQETIDVTAEMITGFDTSVAGEKTLTITYDGVTLSIKCIVA